MTPMVLNNRLGHSRPLTPMLPGWLLSGGWSFLGLKEKGETEDSPLYTLYA